MIASNHFSYRIIWIFILIISIALIAFLTVSGGDIVTSIITIIILAFMTMVFVRVRGEV